MKKQSAMRQLETDQSSPAIHHRSFSVSPALVVMLSALLMMAASACNKTQEQDALGASRTPVTVEDSGEGESQDSAATEEEGALSKDLSQDGQAGTTESATAYVARAPQTPKVSPEEQRAAARKLDGHWLLDAEATLALLPEESREGLREVFGQVRTGVNFSEEGDAIMNVISQGETNEQEGKYAVSDAKEDAVRIEFLIDDPALAEQDVRIFATVIFEDEDTVHYQASTEEKGRVVQREQIAVMKRVTPEKYHNVLKKK